MKKLILIFAILMIGFGSFAQRTITDNINGAETVNFASMYKATQAVVTFTNVGGTTDGTFVLQGSIDGTTFVTLQPTAGLFNYYPSDTANLTGYTQTMIDGDGLLIIIEDNPLNYYRFSATGTVGDTTTATIIWSK